MIPRFFTIGCKSSYDAAFLCRPVIKIGRREVSEHWPDGYVGGIVFTNIHAAQAEAWIYTRETGREFVPYGLITRLEYTYFNKESLSRHLIYDAPALCVTYTTAAQPPAI